VLGSAGPKCAARLGVPSRQLDQKKYIRPETLAHLDPAARFILDV
jgi:hypothetical protein